MKVPIPPLLRNVRWQLNPSRRLRHEMPIDAVELARVVAMVALP